ncbi:hypothetical protein Acsp04_23700 [Actinomadura sp. NBRC 104425]|uniref:hypothetical protein n=1 Tax=Actinomadura sp. NBRC 104425 TaxID=3032204 RepID=UPI0024A60844|nr:hypothetical protein [Actinomadura sp. NBRC 104425]GLZ12135.1 hypothetical protein Acsp04_23700 [Actinomadura sp. NBRC 104425]
MGDNWLGPDTCGVKLAQFEQLTRQMTEAAPKLEALADQLWQSLHGAGVSTAPAMEIKRIAAWAGKAAADLRRRNTLAHNLDRQRLALLFSRPDGTYLTLPDRYTDQVAYADGRRVADLLRKAADRDAAAIAALARMNPEDITPVFAKALLEALGPEEVVRLPMDLASKLGGDIKQQRDGVDARAREARHALAILARSLALGTDPAKRSGYVGQEYLLRLNEMGRAHFPPLSKPPYGMVGYQSLSTLLAAAGDARFSSEFLSTVGGSMIAYDRTHKGRHTWPLPDLAGRYGLGNALDPGTTEVVGGERKTDYLVPLLNAAAASGREGAQRLLGQRLFGVWINDKDRQNAASNLEYLLHQRRAVWGLTDHGDALGKVIKTAASGTDKDSERIAFEAGKLLADDAREYYKVVKQEGRWQVKLDDGKRAEADGLSALRAHMADVLAAHITKVNDEYGLYILGAKHGTTPMSDADLDYLLLELSRDANAFDKLLTAQIAHAQVDIQKAAATGDRTRLTEAVVANAQIFGHLIEARNHAVAAEHGRVEAVNKALQDKVAGLIGLMGDIGATATSTRGGPLAGIAYNALVTKQLQKLSGPLAKPFEQKPDDAVDRPTTNAEAIERLFGQMLVSAVVTQRRIDLEEIKGRSFATDDDPPRIRPLESLTPRQYDELLNWMSDRFGIYDLQERAGGAADRGAKQLSGHYRTDDGRFNVLPSGQR